MIDATELADIRAEFLATLTDTCSVHRRSKGSNVAGSKTYTYAEVAEYPCRIQETQGAVSGIERTSNTREENILNHIVVLPHNADIRTTDRLIIGTVTLEVIGFSPERTDRFTAKVFAKVVDA